MTSARDAKIEALCLEALSKDGADRAVFLDDACEGDEELRREVESLLAERTAAHAFLETPAFAPATTAPSLPPSTRLGPYEILSLVGEGGMGQVYKARDTRLARTVAIKVLPPAFASDPARRARFDREARTIAALSHPNICPLYDVGREAEIDFLVMEHLEGQTLAARLQKGKLPLDQALAIASQIADALSAAHRLGVVHRDLKPANVMLVKAPAGAPGGPQVRLLDFGLAKIEGRGGQPAAAAHGSASVRPLTEEGLIVGTLHYMPPEQLEGKPADAHTDVWALGAILYEMVTGKRAFTGENQAAVISAIMSGAPSPVSAVLPTTPPALDHLITRCLTKNPDERWNSARDLADQLRWLRDASGVGGVTRDGRAPRRIVHRGRLIAFGVASTAIVAAFVAWLTWKPSPAELSASVLTSYSGVETTPSFSPDGSKVAFVWNGDKENNYDVYVKQIGSPGPAMPLTTSPAVEWVAAWSPDDRWIAFYRWEDRRHVQIRLISPLDGLERQVAEAEIVQVRGLAWTPDAKWLIFPEPDAQQRASLTAIQIDTRERRRLTAVQAGWPSKGSGEVYGDLWPSVSRDGRALAFARGANYVYDVYVLALTPDLRPAGEPVRITSANYGMVTGIAWTADSREIVYSAGSLRVQSLWRVPASVGQAPKRLTFAIPDASFPSIAPKTSRLAYVWRVFSASLWRLDTKTKERGILAGSTYDVEFPQYSPDGGRIAFQSNRSGNVEVWVCKADGSNCVQLTSFNGPQCGRPRWSPDSRWLALDSRVGGTSDIYVVAADGSTPRPVTHTAGGSINLTPSWSHDGRSLYFTSDRSGSFEIWKVPVDGGQAEQVTRSGGGAPVASPDGKYIYYIKQSGVFRIPAEGGPEEQVVAQPVDANSFGVTAQGVYFIANGSLQLLDTATGKVNVIAEMSARLNGLCLSPDGRYVLWSQVDRDTSDLMLVENFR